jgi:hypothetical protein
MAYEAYKAAVKTAAKEAFKEWLRDGDAEKHIAAAADKWNIEKHHVREYLHIEIDTATYDTIMKTAAGI